MPEQTVETEVPAIGCAECNSLSGCDCAFCEECSTAYDLSDRCRRCERCPECCNCVLCEGCGRRCDPDSVVCSNCNNVTDCCCQCATCEHCDEPFDSVCTDCHCCERHCDCVHCTYCGDVCENACPNCGRCEDHCHCTDEEDGEDDDETHRPHIDYFRSALTFHAGKPCARNPSRRALSCELEIVGARPGDAITWVARKWRMSIVTDGSISGDAGFEVCTAPSSGTKFVEQITELCAAFGTQRARVDSSCGFHVHGDARSYSWWDVRKLILLYARVEPALFLCVPPSRRQDNTYCQPCGRDYLDWLARGPAKSAKSNLFPAMYPECFRYSDKKAQGRMAKGVRREKYHTIRYKALNLHSWVYRGTLECRTAAGTTNIDKVVNWAVLWAGVLDYAEAHTERDIAGLPKDGWQALLQIAPTDEVRSWLALRRDKFTFENSEGE